jgi:hypothetical protein
MVWERTGISPLIKKSIIEIDAFFNLGEMIPSPHLSEKVPFVKFKGLILFEIGAALDRSNSETEFRESLAISIGDGEGNFAWHH